MTFHKDPTYTSVFALLYGDEDERAEVNETPRFRVLSGGRLEINGIAFAPRGGRDSGFSAPWADTSDGVPG